MAKATRGTIKDFQGFKANDDAEVLRKAMKGLGTDEDPIMKILTSRSNAQRHQIAESYKTLFGRDLIDDLKSELTGKLEKVIVALMTPSNLYDAHELRHAIKGAGTKEDVLIEILASRSTSEINNIKKVFKEEYGSELEDGITGDASGYFQRMLVVLVQANRDPDSKVNDALAEQDAQDLFKAGEVKWGTDEEKFITILGTRSNAHLRKVFDKYMTISGYQIEESIDRETSGHLEKLLLAIDPTEGLFTPPNAFRARFQAMNATGFINKYSSLHGAGGGVMGAIHVISVKSARCVPGYFAETLDRAMKGAGTDDDTLIRVMVSRCEIDMLDIRKEYRTHFGKSLLQAIKGDTSGDYRNTLLLICGGDDE